MQKYLLLLNLRLDVVVKDICWPTGLNIIRAISAGGANPKKLSELRHEMLLGISKIQFRFGISFKG